MLDPIPVRDKLLLTKAEAAAMLSSSEPTLDKLMAQGIVKGVRFPGGRKWYFKLSDLRATIETMGEG